MSSRVFGSVLALAAVVAAALALSAPASAWFSVPAAGQPGRVYMPPVFPYEDGRQTTYGPFLMFTTFGRPYVWRSPATNDEQLVAGVYLIQRWNGNQWYVSSRQSTPMYTIAAGQQGIYLPRLWRAPGANVLTNRGQFRVQLLVAWSYVGGGLGSTVLSPNQVGDLRCRSMLRPCHATATWVRLGRTFATGGGW